MQEVQVFCYIGAGTLAFILSGIFIKCMAYLCNRINTQRQEAAMTAVAAAEDGGFREVAVQSSPSRLEVIVEGTININNSQGIKERKGSLSKINNCAICISEIEEGEILWELSECNHTFHAECIKKWLKKNKSCPLCRTIIVVHHA